MSVSPWSWSIWLVQSQKWCFIVTSEEWAVSQSVLSQHVRRPGVFKLPACSRVCLQQPSLSSNPYSAVCSCPYTQRRFSAPLSPSHLWILDTRTSSPASAGHRSFLLWPGSGQRSNDCSWENTLEPVLNIWRMWRYTAGEMSCDKLF